ESAEVLKKMGIKYKEFPREDCFWGPTGDEGPCGPDVEMFVDDIEVWTLVFNEYYKNANGSYRPLKTKGVDTGMGLERMLVVLNKKNDIYETDVFEPIIKEIEKLSKLKYGDDKDEACEKCWVDVRKQMRVISDHIKAAIFAINDSILPSNKDAGYIVRRLIRRAVIKASQIGIGENFTEEISQAVIKTYIDVYKLDSEKISSELEKEETKFRNTLKLGLKEFEKVKENLDGTVAFKLYETYGFPIEMTEELAKENKIQINKREFEEAFKSHQEKSRTASKGKFKGGLQSGGEQETKFHTATHLLLASLREVLGKDVNQKGANINSERIRFDFNYPEKLSDEQIKKIEDWVNDKISQNLDVEMKEMSVKEALESGATSIPGMKYPNIVKVFSIGPSTSSGQPCSVEICGGPHVKNTSELGKFKIIKEESSSSGIRRIKAVLE
ncbi:hypothetical protein A2V71_00135, partial [Candidatus Berkelbacteria bacterium RBG_13_40_8]